MSEYKEVDRPFCVLCSRFMITHVGLIRVALNHLNDEKMTVRMGRAYKCPKCGHTVISKWEDLSEIDGTTLRNIGYWTIFLEDHIHINKNKAKKD